MMPALPNKVGSWSSKQGQLLSLSRGFWWYDTEYCQLAYGGMLYAWNST